MFLVLRLFSACFTVNIGGGRGFNGLSMQVHISGNAVGGFRTQARGFTDKKSVGKDYKVQCENNLAVVTKRRDEKTKAFGRWNNFLDLTLTGKSIECV